MMFKEKPTVKVGLFLHNISDSQEDTEWNFDHVLIYIMER